MDTKKLEALLVSAQTGSFTKAAQALGCTQSGLTHMMNALEQEVGFPLLERGHYGARFTERGAQLEPAIRQFLEAGRELEAQMAAIRRQESRWLRVGAYSSMAVHWLPAVLQSFRRGHPDVRVDVQMGGIEELYSWVRTGEVDLAFVSRQDDLKADFLPLKEDTLVAILPDERRYDGWSACPVSEFEGREFLMPALGFNRDIMPLFRRHHVHPRIRKTTVDDPVVISMVAHGLGASIMTELIMTGQSPASVKVLPIEPRAYRELGIVVRSRRELKTAVQDLIQCARETIDALDERPMNGNTP